MRIAYWPSESVRILRQWTANCKKSPRNTYRKLKTLQYCCALPNGARGIIASIYWRSAGIPNYPSLILQQISWTLFLPILPDITYWFFFTGAETEIHKIKDNSKINREKNINRRGQRHIVNVWHLPDHPAFSLPTAFKVNLKEKNYLYVNSTLQRCPNKIVKAFLIEDFLYLPPVLLHWWWTLISCEYLREFLKKIEMTLRGLGETDLWKNRKSKISWHSPFKENLLLNLPWILIWGWHSFKTLHGSWPLSDKSAGAGAAAEDPRADVLLREHVLSAGHRRSRSAHQRHRLQEWRHGYTVLQYLLGIRGLKRDDVYLWWPIPRIRVPMGGGGGGGELRGFTQF